MSGQLERLSASWYWWPLASAVAAAVLLVAFVVDFEGDYMVGALSALAAIVLAVVGVALALSHRGHAAAASDTI